MVRREVLQRASDHVPVEGEHNWPRIGEESRTGVASDGILVQGSAGGPGLTPTTEGTAPSPSAQPHPDRELVPLAIRILGRPRAGIANEAILNGLQGDLGLIGGASVHDTAQEIQRVVGLQKGHGAIEWGWGSNRG